MLKREPATSRTESPEEQIDLLPQLDLLSILRLFRKDWPRFVLVVIACLALAVAYYVNTPRRYTTSFSVLVAVKNRDILATSADTGETARIVDPGEIESQVEILKSASVVREAVRKLDLAHNDAFMNAGASPLSRLAGLIKLGFAPEQEPPSEAELEQDAVRAVTEALKPKRAGVTYVVDVDVTGPTPQLTLDIASAIADAYLSTELRARYDSSRRATSWFQDQLLELQRNVVNSDLAVQTYKSSNNIVDTAHGLIDEAQLSDVNSQLVAAQATTAEAKARMDAVEAVLNGDFTNAAVSDALKSDVITRLRAQYLDLASSAADLTQRYGAGHQSVIDVRAKMKDIAAAANEELKRIAQSNRSDYEIARAREVALRGSMNDLIVKVGAMNQSQVALRNLESAAQAYRNMYDAFLQKFQQSSQEQTVPLSTARLITAPVLPEHAAWPRLGLVLGGGLVAGSLLGFANLVLIEMLGNGFKTPEDVRLYAGLECLGTLPRVAVRRAPRSTADEAGVTMLGRDAPLTRHTLLQPFSRFTETVRNAYVSIDLEMGSDATPVVGVVSAIPKEGKTSFVANLAMLTSQLGRKTLVIDGDIHTCALTRALAPQAKTGLLEALEQGRLDDFTLVDAATRLNFLPTVVTKRLNNTAEILKSKSMQALLNEARKNYDYVFVDLPPLLPVVDAKAAAHMFDGFVYIIAWKRTSRDVVRASLLDNAMVRQRVIGVFLNSADPTQLRRLESYHGYGNYWRYASKASPSA